MSFIREVLVYGSIERVIGTGRPGTRGICMSSGGCMGMGMSGSMIIAGLMDMVRFRVKVRSKVMADFRPQSIRNVRTLAVSQPYLNASDTKHPTFSTHFRQACYFWHDIGTSFGCT